MKTTHSKDEGFIRLIIMVLFAIVLNISISVVMIIGFVQWIIRMFRDDEIIRLKEFSSSLNEFNYQIGQFLTLNTEQKPFPFSDWPESDYVSEDEQTQEVQPEEKKEANQQSKQETKQQSNPEVSQESHLEKQQESDLSKDGSIIDQDLTDEEQLDAMKESDS